MPLKAYIIEYKIFDMKAQPRYRTSDSFFLLLRGYCKTIPGPPSPAYFQVEFP